MSDSTFERTQTPWFKERGLSSVLEAWRSNPAIERCLRLDERIPEKGAQLADFPEEMSLRLREALQALGMPSLYTHQSQAFQLASTGSHLVVATPTASGKSLCYNLPVLERLIRVPDARALYLFPTKALARDQ